MSAPAAVILRRQGAPDLLVAYADALAALAIGPDARRIRRILQNLLGNAIDHGEGLRIDVYVDSDAEAVAIAVRDHGIGMSKADMERVFDRFWRADPSRRRTTGGTGLGLAISQEDAVVHGGLLDVWSEPGQGSCFRLTLPRRFGDQVMGSPLPMPPEELLDDELLDDELLGGGLLADEPPSDEERA